MDVSYFFLVIQSEVRQETTLSSAATSPLRGISRSWYDWAISSEGYRHGSGGAHAPATMNITRTIARAFLLLSLAGTPFLVAVAQAEAPVPVVAHEKAPHGPWTQEEVKSLVPVYAALYGASQAVLEAVISCESGYRWDESGDHGESWGAVQIHLPDHPDISKAQALDPEFAVGYLARNVAQGRGSMWTCYRMLGKQ